MLTIGTIIDIMYLVETVRTTIFAKKCMLHKFAIPILLFVKSIISDMHHRITYMYINFQQNLVSKSVKTVRTNIFANNCS